ncbi:MAG: T9SS type A sorting domain-containing protein [Chitinophagaceae bacterium]
MRIQSLPKTFLAAFVIFFSALSIDAQTINVVPETNSQYDYITSGYPLWGYTGNPIVFNNQLCVQYQRVPYDLASNNEVPKQLAQYSSNTLNLIANPDTVYNFKASGYVGNPIVFNNKLYINYQNAAGPNQLAVYNGTNLQLIANPDASPYGYQGVPIIFNNALYFLYANVAGIQQLAKFDGSTVTLIPNPDASPYGYQGSPIIFNGKLYIRYSINSGPNYPWALASFDGSNWKVYPNPDASNYGYQGNQIIYNGKLYGRYASSITGKSQLMVCDGSSNPTLIADPDAGYGYNGFPIVYNNNLFIQYKNNSNVLQLASFNGTAITLIPNPDATNNGYQGTPMIYNNTLCLFYNNISNVNHLAVYKGGDTFHLVPNPDASTHGYWNFPVVYGANLYFQYYNASGNYQLGYFDGTDISLVPNPGHSPNGTAAYSGAPFVFNNLLYMKFDDVQYDGFANLAYFDSKTLPVTFLNFDGVLQNQSAHLTWSTANEINDKGFEVQKSMDGQTFTDIGFVNGQGNSTTVNNYNYTDPKILSGSNYYRLKQIDNDGRFTYSSVIKLDYSKFDWAILGNASNNMWVQVQLDKSANVTVQIISMNGNIIQTIEKGNMNAGTYSIPLNLKNTSSGMYVVKLVVDNQSYSKKIIK